MYLIVVKRGDFRRQETLHKAFGQQAPVIWDRRQRQRRKADTVIEGEERRRGERRGPDQTSWTALGFVVVRGRD
jgi:hypothetical protein